MELHKIGNLTRFRKESRCFVCVRIALAKEMAAEPVMIRTDSATVGKNVCEREYLTI